MNKLNIKVLDQVALFHLDAHLWSGRKKLRPEDVRGQVPPAKLASLGSKRIVNPKQVAKFESLKRRAERVLHSSGLRVMGAYAVPIEKVQAVIDELEEIKVEFNSKLAEFIQNYDEAVKKWILDQQEWGEIIRSSITPVADIKNQMSFGWQVYHLKPTGNSAIDEGLNEQIGGLGQRLIQEISSEAARIFEKQYLLKTRVPATATGTISALHQKMLGLAFLDAKAGALCAFLGNVLSEAPKSGFIEGEALNKLFGMLLVLSDEEKIMHYGQQLLDGVDITGADLVELSGSDYLTASEAREVAMMAQADLLAQSENKSDSDNDEAEAQGMVEEEEQDLPDQVVAVPKKATIAPQTWF